MIRKTLLALAALVAFVAVGTTADRAEAGGPRSHHVHSSHYFAPAPVYSRHSSYYSHSRPLPIYGVPYGYSHGGSHYRPVPTSIYSGYNSYYRPRSVYGSSYGYGSGIYIGTPGFSLRIGR